VRIVSIGASEEEADDIDIRKSLNKWAFKLTNLNT